MIMPFTPIITVRTVTEAGWALLACCCTVRSVTMKQFLQLFVCLVLLQLTAGSVSITVTPDDTTFNVGTLLNLTCSSNNGATFSWSADCYNNECFPFYTNNDSATVSTLDRARTPVLTSVDNGNYTCTATNQSMSLEITVKGSGVFDEVSLTSVANNSYFLSDINGFINVILHCIGATNHGIWLMPDNTAIGSESFTVDMQYGSTILKQTLSDIGGDSSGSGSGGGSIIVPNEFIEGYYLCVAPDENGDYDTLRVGLFRHDRAPPVINSLSVSDNPALAGMHVQLTCDVNTTNVSPSMITYSWYHNDDYIINDANDSSVLFINLINASYYGNYSCVVSNIVGEDSATITIEQAFQPVITSITGNIIVILPNPYTVLCQATGYPLPVVTVSLIEDGVGQNYTLNDTIAVYELAVNNSDIAHSGLYQCTASNEFGTITENFTITVLVAAGVMIEQEEYVVVENSTLSIMCSGSGYPLPDMIIESDHYTINQSLLDYNIINDYMVIVTLTITDITPLYTGQYRCIGNNSVSVAVEQFNITVEYSPVLVVPVMDIIANYTDQANVTLSCAINGEPVPVITWYYQQNIITDSTDYSILTTTNTNGTVSSQLTTINITPNDSGQYTCNASNTIGYIVTNGIITIYAIPVVVTDAIQYIRVDMDPINISCIATGVPAPNISWYQLDYMSNNPDIINDGYKEVTFTPIEETMLSNGLYQVTQIMTIILNMSYTAEYYCVAVNSLDTIQTEFNITVQYIPELISGELSDKTAIFTQQSSVVFSCISMSEPIANIYWYYNNGLLISDTKYTITNIINIDDTINSTLTINNISVTDTGLYMCNATNSVGYNVSEATLTVNAIPVVFTDAIQYIRVDMDPINISCNATGVPAPNISWYQLDYMSNNPDIINDGYKEVTFTPIEETMLSNGLYQVTQIMTIILNMSYTAEYYCVAVNSLDTIQTEFNITVQYIPELISGELSDKTAIFTQQSSVIFSCISMSEPIANIYWYYNNGLLISDTKYTITNIINIDDTINSTLTINNISVTDTGLYMCNATNSVGYNVSEATLTVNVLPQLTQVSNDIIVIQPDSVILYCLCTGIPRPSIVWYYNNMIQMGHTDIDIADNTINSSLIINDTDPFDAGAYTCNCSNVAGYDDTGRIEITVHVIPIVTIAQMEYLANETDEIIILCSSTGIPSPDLEWYRNGTKLSNETQSITIIDSFSTQPLISSLLYEVNQTLIITNLNDTDTNIYTCMANNTAGSVSNDVNLTVNYGPRLITGIYNYTVNESDSFTMICIIEGRPHPPISWWFTNDSTIAFAELSNNNNIIITNTINGQIITSTFGITNISRTQHGFYKCNSSNILGTVESYGFITVNFITAITSNPSDKVIVQPNNVVFTCIVEGRPIPSTTWYNNTIQLSQSPEYNIDMISITDTIINSTLTINTVIPFDDGVYTCVAGNLLNEVSTNANLTVHVIPSIISPMANNQYTVNQSFPVSITCISIGIPAPILSWYKDELPLILDTGIIQDDNYLTQDGVLTSTEQTLIINMTDSLTDTGNYTCQANNTAGIDNLYFNIFVQVRPVVTATDNDRYIISIEDTPTIIQFIITDAIPVVTVNDIHWMFSPSFSADPYDTNNTDITNNNNYIYSTDKRMLTIASTHLNDDEGRYYMIAVNPAGIHYDYTDVIVHGPPKLITGPVDTTVTNGNSVTFICEGRADPQHDVMWTFNNTNIASTTINNTQSSKYLLNSDIKPETTYGSLLVMNVQYSDRGIYQCFLNNIVSTIDSSASLTVEVTPIIHDVTSSLSLNITEPLTLYCVAIGYPNMEFKWSKNDQPIGSNTEGITMTTVPFNDFNETDLSHLNNIEYISLIGYIGILKFDSVARDDTAQYNCTATTNGNVVAMVTSDGITITVLERPDPPINVLINETSVTSRTVELSWQPAFDGNRDILGYQIYLRDSDDVMSDFIQIGTQLYTTNNTYYDVTGLIPYIKYEFIILACNMIGCTLQEIATPTNPIRTLPDRPDSAPRNCTAISYNSTSLTIQWSIPAQPNGLMEYYQIQYASVGSAFSDYCTIQHNDTINSNNNETTFILTGLNKATIYSLSIIAYTVIGSGPPTIDNCTQATLYDVPETPPFIFKTISLTSTSININWNLPINNNIPCRWNGPIIQYLITYRQSVGVVTNNVTVNSQLSYTLTKLAIFTEYIITVSAGTVIGFGELSTSQPIRTLNDTSSKPSNVQLNIISDTTDIMVSWKGPDYPNGVITKYMVYYQASKDSNDAVFDNREQNISSPNNGGQYNLTGLYGSSTYTISVAAVNGAGIGNRSDIMTIDTPPAAPPTGPAPSPGVMVPNERQFQIVLEKPSAVNGPISHYHLMVVLLPNGELPDSPPDELFPSFNTSFKTYDYAISYNGIIPVSYIAAEFSDSLFPIDNMYIIGDENEIDDGEYTNGLLKYSTSFTFFLRAYPLLDERFKRQVPNRQYDEFSSSNYYTDVFVTVEEPSNVSTTIAVVISVLLILLIAMTITVVLLLLIIFYRRRSQKLTFRDTPARKDRHEVVSITSDFSLSPIPSFQNPAYHDESDVDGLSQQFSGHPSIPIGEFGKIVDRLHANDNFMLRQEYDEICTKSPQPSVDVCLNPVNKCRNRYANIQAYDHSRVKLIPVEGFPHDYINANFLNGYNRENEYIGTQGPLPDTLGDFWRMVWDHNVITIVMLTNVVEKMRVKCSQYWPEGVGLSDQYANIRVCLLKCVTHADYSIRTFEIQADGSKEIRYIKQFHYMSWPDFGVPRHSTPLLQFLRVVRRNHKYTDTRPIIVHCSAGVGRTGTFVSIDTEMQRAKHEGMLNPYSYVRALRNNRNHMVQTEAQYVFLHDALLEVITTGWTDIGIEQLSDRMAELEEEDDQGESGFLNEFNRLKTTQQYVNEYGSAMNNANKFKNRIINALPYDYNRVKLSVTPGEPGSDYINASFIDGYKSKNVFIATQGPLENTVDDFWRMIWEHGITVIVMLCNAEERGQTLCHQYWPKHAGETMTIGQYHITCLQELTTFDDYIRRELKITYITNEDKGSHVIHHYQYTTWPRTGAPLIGAGILDMMDQMIRSQQQTGDKPVVVHCSAGVGRTGTFCALSIAIERVKIEQVVNMFNTIKHLRTQRAHMVQTLDQYIFCYRAILEYVDGMSNYANFQTSI